VLPGSSHGVLQRSPLHRHPPRASTPGFPRLGHCHVPNTFRPCRSSRLRRFAPHGALRVCCTPQPIMRFTWFQAVHRHSPVHDPPPRCHTLRSFSLFGSGFPVARAPTLSPLPPHHRSAASSRPQGLVPPSSPLSLDRVATVTRPDAPLGFPRLSALTAARWSPSSRSPTKMGVPTAPKCCARRGSLP
jgi:hypothetical protein